MISLADKGGIRMKQLLCGRRGIAPVLIVVIVVLGVLVVGTVGAGMIFLSDDVVFTVNNQSCGTLDIAKGTAALNLNFLPGINVPSQIAEGESASVQIPRLLIQSVIFSASSVDVLALGRTLSISTSSLDLDRSTLDGIPLSGWIGSEIDLKMDHVVGLACK